MNHTVLKTYLLHNGLLTRFLLLIGFLTIPMVTFASDIQGFETRNIVLYQQDQVLKARVGKVNDLADYIKQVQEACTTYFGTVTKPNKPEDLHIVIGIRPGNRSKIWFISSLPQDHAPNRDPLRKKLEAIIPFNVVGGPVAFAITGTIAGGGGTLPIPKEWSDVPLGKDSSPVPECYLDVIWPDVPAKR